MSKLPVFLWVVATVLAISSVQAAPQQDQGPVIPKAKPKPKSAAATLLVVCDLACNWKLDGEAKGHIDAGASAKAQVVLGQHLVVATTEDDADEIKQTSEVKSAGQTLVNIELKPVRDARLKDLRDRAPDANPTPSALNSASLVPAGSIKIAVISFQIAVTQTNEFQHVFQDLQKRFEPQKNQLQQLNNEADTLTRQLQAQSAGLSDAERANRARSIDDKKKQAQRLEADARKDFQAAMQETYGSVAPKVDKLLVDYARRQDYTYVIDGTQDATQTPLVIYVDPTEDITKTIVDAYNAGSGAPSSTGQVGAAKIAAIQFQTAVGQTNEFQRGLADLQKKFEPQRNQLQQMTTEIDSLAKQLQTQSYSLSDAERSERARTIDNRKKQEQRLQEDAQNDYQAAMQDLFNKIAQKVFEVLVSYNKENGYTLALDTSSQKTQSAAAQKSIMLYAASSTDITKFASTDITKAVINAYNVKSGVPAPSGPMQNLPAQ